LIFFVRQNLTWKLPENLHVAPPECGESEFSIKSTRMGVVFIANLKIQFKVDMWLQWCALRDFGQTTVAEQRLAAGALQQQ